jgi:hypothetical protein
MVRITHLLRLAKFTNAHKRQETFERSVVNLRDQEVSFATNVQKIVACFDIKLKICVELPAHQAYTAWT